MFTFYVNWISAKPSVNNTHQVLLQPLDAHSVERDVTVPAVWCCWIPASVKPEYDLLLSNAKSAGKKFAIEVAVATVTAKPVFTTIKGVSSQDLTFKFSGKVTKSVVDDHSVIW